MREKIDISNWNECFNDKFINLNLLSKHMEFFMNEAIRLIDFFDLNIDEDIFKKYILGDKIETEDYKHIRIILLNEFFKIKTNDLDAKQILLELKSKMFKMLLDNFFRESNVDSEIIEVFLSCILEYNISTVRLDIVDDNEYIDENRRLLEVRCITDIKELSDSYPNNDYNKIVEILNPKLMLKTESCNIIVSEECSNVKSVRYEIVLTEKEKYIKTYFTFMEDQHEGWDWYSFIENCYIEFDIKYSNPKQIWEYLVLDSFMSYKIADYNYAFLKLFIAFESVVEDTVLKMKNLIADELYKQCNSCNNNLNYMIQNIYVNNKKIENDLMYYIHMYKRMCKDSRNLISEKFVDVINFNNFIYTKDKTNLFEDKESEYGKCQTELKNLNKMRNTIAHGENYSGIDFQKEYVSLISILLKTILDLKGFDAKDIIKQV